MERNNNFWNSKQRTKLETENSDGIYFHSSWSPISRFPFEVFAYSTTLTSGWSRIFLRGADSQSGYANLTAWKSNNLEPEGIPGAPLILHCWHICQPCILIWERLSAVYGTYKYLPPATKFGQGYIFAGVCDSVRGGLLGRGGSAPEGRRAWSRGGLVWGVPGGDTPGMATAAGDTHPTGMHSCLICNY